MQSKDKYETLTGRFNPTIATLLMLIGLLFLTVTATSAKTITVTGLGDTIAVDGVVTLREAICAANTNAVCGDAPKGDPGADIINFNIPGSGVRTIIVNLALPTIIEPLTIDGYSQRPCTSNPAPCSKPNTLLNGSDAVLLIELNGINTNGFTNGLSISAGNTTVRGLVINRFIGNGIRIVGGSGGDVIEGNFISTDPTGTIALPNKTTGIYVTGAPNCLIGGTTPAARNLISGNSVLPTGASAIEIDGQPNTPLPGTMIQGNFIGTNAAGTAVLANVGAGIILAYTSNTTIGGTSSGARNIISGSLYGIEIIPGGGSIVQGNYIGTDVTGTVDLGNKETGISIGGLSTNNLIGGTVAGARNVVSGNGSSGIELNGGQVSGTVIQGNYVGVDATGMKKMGNSASGVSVILSIANTIGGTVPAARNIISGNDLYGVLLASGANNNQVQGNFIGTAVDGLSPVGNASGVGILNASDTNTIGGTVSGSGNLIAFNLGNGVLVNQSSLAINNAILGNAIVSNADLGISLKGGNFPINNDLNDTDPGGNNQQNYPVITSAASAGGLTAIQGTLNSDTNKSYRIEFFANTSCHAAAPKDYGQGQTFIGFSNVTTVGNDASFKVNFPVAIPPGQFITTTATDPTGNTSEFSRCTQVTVPAPSGNLVFSTGSYNVAENAGLATVTVKRVGGGGGAVSVQYATVAGGTATAGSDFTDTNGTLNWADGDLTDKTFKVAVSNDSLNESSETVNLTLSNPAGGASLGNPSNAVLTIADDDAQPTISISDVSLAEGNSGPTSFSFDVTLSAASGQSVTVDYLSADGTALVGGDYQVASGTLTFAPGETTRSVSVMVNGDTQDEPTETFVVNLSNPANVTIAKGQGTGTVVNDDAAAPPTIQFSQAAYGVAEQLGAITVTVTRSGDATKAASVDYATADGSAAQKTDFEYAAGTLNFGPGEVSKTFIVLLNQDSYVEGPESFNLVLSDPAGVALGAQAVSQVSITDDLPETLSNPIDDAQTFVYMHYHDFLSREPDPAGLAFWTNEITSCGNNAQCVDNKRINVSAAFFLSIEFQETGYLRYLMQKASFGSTPRYAEFMRDVQEVSRGVIVKSPGWEQKLKDNQQQFAEKWIARPEFKAVYDGLSNDGYVNALYTNAGIPAPQAEKDKLVAALNDASMNRAAVLLDVANDPTFRQQEQNAAFVMMEYFGYLRRDPNAAPDSDLSGYNFWLNKLNQFSGNYVDAEMIKAFITSFEYRQRFAQ